ncbi:MAG: stringent starvation protein A [Gammaproteobacteria bacterium]|nr:stringent starvation protein A [Gammaproteobacteria bacterium]
MSLSSRHTPLKLYSDPTSQYSHRVRIALSEKDLDVERYDVLDPSKDEDLLLINPSMTLPTLQDRGTVLNNSSVIMEYLDERYPHPPLFPIYPVDKARSRSIMREVDDHLASFVDVLAKAGKPNTAQKNTAREALKSNLVAFQSHYLRDEEHFGSEEFTLVDCAILPILWRLEIFQIKLPDRSARSLRRYMNRLFEREGFQASLSEEEKEMR